MAKKRKGKVFWVAREKAGLYVFSTARLKKDSDGLFRSGGKGHTVFASKSTFAFSLKRGKGPIKVRMVEK